jgi:hypothetical protein
VNVADREGEHARYPWDSYRTAQRFR